MTFLVLFLLLGAIVVMIARNKSDYERALMEQLIAEKSLTIKDTISRLIYKTQTLSVMITSGELTDGTFEEIAKSIVDDPVILNVLIAPNGIVSRVHPLEGNEGVLGHNLYGPAPGNREAIIARDTGELVFGGPFTLVQGGVAVVGRLPVFLNGSEDAWGLVSVTIRYPEVLESAGLNTLELQGYSYEIWRISPDDGGRQVIASSANELNTGAQYVERHIPLFNADWYFRLSPLQQWYQYTETWIAMLVAVTISFLTGFVVQNNVELQRVKQELEGMVRTDMLTGAHNRVGLQMELKKLIQADRRFCLYYLDLDMFKAINDTYGHAAGDMVLTEFSRRILLHTDRSHIFCRLSGDEFILVCIENPNTDVEAFWARIDDAFSKSICVGDTEIFLKFSKGIACYPGDAKSADKLIARADKRMYADKQKRKRAIQQQHCQQDS